MFCGFALFTKQTGHPLLVSFISALTTITVADVNWRTGGTLIYAKPINTDAGV